MKIQFFIKESLNDVVDQLSNSDFWSSDIKYLEDRRIIKIKDLAYDLEATAEVWSDKIIIHTAWSNFTYSIFVTPDSKVCCEYVGAFRGLLDQKLLPHLTPIGNVLDYEVLESSLYKPGERKTLREYARDNARQRRLREQSKEAFHDYKQDVNLHKGFVKEDMPSAN